MRQADAIKYSDTYTHYKYVWIIFKYEMIFCVKLFSAMIILSFICKICIDKRFFKFFTYDQSIVSVHASSVKNVLYKFKRKKMLNQVNTRKSLFISTEF